MRLGGLADRCGTGWGGDLELSAWVCWEIWGSKVPICSGLSEIEGFGECGSSSVKTRIVLANRAMRVALDRASELGKGPLSPTSKSYLFI